MMNMQNMLNTQSFWMSAPQLEVQDHINHVCFLFTSMVLKKQLALGASYDLNHGAPLKLTTQINTSQENGDIVENIAQS